MAELGEKYSRRPEEEEEEDEEAGRSNINTTSWSSEKKKQDDACWQDTMQRVLSAQELGNNCVRTVSMVTRLRRLNEFRCCGLKCVL